MSPRFIGWALGLAFYAGMATLTYQAEMVDYMAYRAHHHYPMDGHDTAMARGWAIFAAAVPPLWITTAIATGGYYYLRHPEERCPPPRIGPPGSGDNGWNG